MIYCRGCGHQIHETAIQCPQCGAVTGAPHIIPDDKTTSNYFLLAPAIFLGVVSLVPMTKGSMIGQDDCRTLIFVLTIIIILSLVHWANYKGAKTLIVTLMIFSILGIRASISHMK